MKMAEIAILEINNLLQLINTTRLTDNEIIILTKESQAPVDLCGYYNTTNALLEMRSVYDPNVKQQSELLSNLAKVDNCNLKTPILKIPDVNIPFFAGGL